MDTPVLRSSVLVLASTYPRWVGDHQPAFVHELCRRLAAEREVTVLVPGAPDAAASEVRDGIRIVRYRYAPGRMETLAYGAGIMANLRSHPWRIVLVPALIASMSLALHREVRSKRWDVVHAHWSIPQGLVAASVLKRLRSSKPKFVLTVHGSDLLSLRGRVWDALNRYVLRSADIVTVVGPGLEARARELGVKEERLHRFPMGVDTEARFVPRPGAARVGPPRILFVGRLTPEKGPDLAIRALSVVLQSHMGASLAMVGDGSERDRLENLAASLGISAHVRFLGAVSQERLPPMYQAASVCIVPSRSEGFGLTAIEAMACGCPTVLADLPSLREIALGGEAAILSPAGNAEAFAAAIRNLLNDHGARLALGIRAHARAQDYSWVKASRAYARLLDGVSGLGDPAAK